MQLLSIGSNEYRFFVGTLNDAENQGIATTNIAAMAAAGQKITQGYCLGYEITDGSNYVWVPYVKSYS